MFQSANQHLKKSIDKVRTQTEITPPRPTTHNKRGGTLNMVEKPAAAIKADIT